MADYLNDVFPHRNNIPIFVNRLLEALPRAYTENMELGYSGRRPGSGQSMPRELDKVRVRALLDAWNRHISDRYLDLPMIVRLEVQIQYDLTRGRDHALRKARTRIEQNAPQGAVKFIYNELRNDRDVTEARTSDRGSYNWMYSALLHWCDDHCYGLISRIYLYRQMAGGAGGGDSALPIIYQAAWQWIYDLYRARRGVYSRYFLS
jgi:hypothetical protein